MSFRTDAVPSQVVELLSRSAGILKALPEAYLAGGTALSLYFAHRVSVDLDFFVPQSFLAEDLRPRLAKAGQFSPITVRNDSIVCRVDAVQWSLFKYEYPLLETPKRYHRIRIASVRDIAAMKVVAIGDRGSRKDFYDLKPAGSIPTAFAPLAAERVPIHPTSVRAPRPIASGNRVRETLLPFVV